MKSGMALVMRSKTKNDDSDVLGGDVCFFLVDLGIVYYCIIYVLCIYIYTYTLCLLMFFWGGWEVGDES